MIKDRIDNCFYSFFNLLSNLLFCFNFKTKKIVKENLKFKNIHSDLSRCFILGTGPSLKKIKKEEFLFLKNEIVFGVNSLYEFDAINEIVPKYYFLLDNHFWGKKSNQLRAILDKYDGITLFTSIKAKHFIDSSNINSSRVQYLYSKLYPTDSVNIDLHKNLSIGVNVICTAIEVALYMGFKEIYLLGCDFSAFASPYDEHCYDVKESDKKKKKNNLAFYLKFYSITAQIHYLLNDKARQMGCKIINLTENTLLDAYPLSKIESVIKENK